MLTETGRSRPVFFVHQLAIIRLCEDCQTCDSDPLDGCFGYTGAGLLMASRLKKPVYDDAGGISPTENLKLPQPECEGQLWWPAARHNSFH